MRLIRPSAVIVHTDGMTLEQQIERAGRCCYKSECKIQDQASAEKFCTMIIKNRHESVLEHGNIIVRVETRIWRKLKDLQWPWLRLTDLGGDHLVSGNVRAWRDAARLGSFVMTHQVGPRLATQWPTLFDDKYHQSDACIGSVTQARIVDLSNVERFEHEQVMTKWVIDRSVSHEIVRHRPCSFSQESTRYCDYAPGGKVGDLTFIIPPWCTDIEPGEYQDEFPIRQDAGTQAWVTSMLDAEDKYNSLRAIGWKPEQARSVLPNSLKTEIIVSATRAQWEWMFHLRCAETAHPQMREVAIPLREEFRTCFGLSY